MPHAFLGIDIGTSGVKALLVDRDGTIVARAGSEYPIAAPHPLWSEQDPRDWWRGVCDGIRAVLARPGVRPGDVAAVGLTGQMHGLVALDAHGGVVRPCILWNDQRSGDECRDLTGRVGPADVLRITGKPLLPGFTAPKILWMRRREPEAYARVATILLPKDYIRYALTGALFSDVSDASGTSLLDTGARAWSDDMIAALSIPRAWLPAVGESTVVTASVSAAASRETGLPAGIPVVGGAGDQAAEAVGCGVLDEGTVSVAIGTSGVVFAGMPRYAYDDAGGIHAYCHAAPGMWHFMGVMLSAGGSLRWYRDTIGALEREAALARGADAYDVLSDAASRVPPGSDGLLFLPYLTGERSPHADPYARGAFIGATLRHARPHFVRAVMEGVSFGLRDILELVRARGIPVDGIRVSGGGSRSAVWRQMLADVFSVPVHTVNTTDGAAFGAAMLAAVGAGAFDGVRDAIRALVRVTGRTDPGPSSAAYERWYPRYRSLYASLRDDFRAIARTEEELRDDAARGGGTAR